jgi:hypothetical protein
MRPLKMSDIRDAQLRVVPSYWTAEAYRSAWEEVPVSFERHTFGRYSFVLTVIFQVLFCVCSTSDDLLVQVQPFMIVNITRYRSMYDAALFTVMRTYAACSGPVHCACCVSLQMILLIISSLCICAVPEQPAGALQRRPARGLQQQQQQQQQWHYTRPQQRPLLSL